MAKRRKHRYNNDNVVSFPEKMTAVSIKPLNYTQKQYYKSIMHNDVTFGIGPAGTGKTYLAAKIAMKYMVNGDIDKIIICRPAVNAGNEQLGFLPGNIHDKMDPYIKPILDVFGERWSMRTIKDYINDGKIEIIPLAYMRGRSLKRSFIIGDEMQNASRELLLMLLTRLDEGSKMVITGDPVQSDIKDDCLYHAERYISHIQDIGFVKFHNEDIVRHPTVGRILTAWPDNGFTE